MSCRYLCTFVSCARQQFQLCFQMPYECLEIRSDLSDYNMRVAVPCRQLHRMRLAMAIPWVCLLWRPGVARPRPPHTSGRRRIDRVSQHLEPGKLRGLQCTVQQLQHRMACSLHIASGWQCHMHSRRASHAVLQLLVLWSGGSARCHSCCPRPLELQLGTSAGSNYWRAAPPRRSHAQPRQWTLAPSSPLEKIKKRICKVVLLFSGVFGREP